MGIPPPPPPKKKYWNIIMSYCDDKTIVIYIELYCDKTIVIYNQKYCFPALET